MAAHPRSKRVAVAGSGSAGIAAIWALSQTSHDVYLYEAADRLGGHTNTVKWKHGSQTTNVDTGFIVLNTATYPNFINFLNQVHVDTVPTEMTFGVSRDRGRFEWSGTNLDAVFSQRRNIFSPRFWRMIFDIVRFNQFALDLIGDDISSPEATQEEETIGQYLERQGYSDAFRDDYLIPMTAAVWSTSPDKCSLHFPATTLVRFMWNHHLLSTVATRPDWLTIPVGSKAYIDAVMSKFPAENVFLNTAVSSASNQRDGRIVLEFTNGSRETFDHVILATHGDQAYSIIRAGASKEEHAIMSAFHTSENTAVLHSDLSLMPSSRKAWSSWNYLTLSSPTDPNRSIDQVSLTYNMNILQHIPRETFGNVLVTLNPLQDPDPSTVQGRYCYTHPLYNNAAIKAQRLLPRIQNKRGISYAGAWTKYGFHEDGFSSGLAVAREHLGAELPFPFVDSTFSRGRRPKLGLADLVLRAVLVVIQVGFVGILDRIYGFFSSENCVDTREYPRKNKPKDQ